MCAVLSNEVVQSAQDGATDGHQFIVDLPAEPLAANADRDKLRQVFSILLDNALKYSRDGGKVTVGVELKRDTVEVSVADGGDWHPASRPGSDLSQVLSRRRCGNARRRKRDGTRFVHRPRPRDGHGRQDLGRIARRRRIDICLRVARCRNDQGPLGK